MKLKLPKDYQTLLPHDLLHLQLYPYWTVKIPGKVVPPVCNDYNTWTVLQLRKECTEIKLRLPRTTSKPEQIKHLKDHDAAYMVVQTTVDDEYTMEPRLRKTKHYWVRLLYALFSDRFAIRLASSEDAATRKQIDAGGTVNNPLFDCIDPSKIVLHEIPRLYGIWKKANRKYVKAYSKFYVSGQNSNEFYSFCEGNLDIVYLRACSAIMPGLEEYVRGETREEDEVDSLDLKGYSKRARSSKSLKWRDGLLKTINRVVDIDIGDKTTTTTPQPNASAPHPEV
ncbi:hypothetical protein JG688_00012268 [Phytophthora aleatoria]|uniref:Uncharacterized protein n=1 Tax=Phytophthora aleatoria TaxID=2496075 RepID=A0A8J5IB64_9STRA|nr:hypothetical protein JG688_00012268 [Phytophthora aleatoria]